MTYELVKPYRVEQKSRRGPNYAYGGGPVVTVRIVDAEGKLVATMHSRMDAKTDAEAIAKAVNG